MEITKDWHHTDCQGHKEPEKRWDCDCFDNEQAYHELETGCDGDEHKCADCWMDLVECYKE